MLKRLFLYLVDKPKLLPVDFQREIEKDGIERTVLDYVAG